MTRYNVRYGGQDDRLLVEDCQDVSGGENNRIDASKIGNNQATKLQNVSIKIPGERTKRKGYTVFDKEIAGDKKVEGLAAYSSTSGGAQKLYVVSNGKLYEASSGVSWGAAITGYTALTAAEVWMVVADNLLCIGSQSNNVRTYNGSDITDEGDTNTDPPKGKVATYFQNRLFVANSSTNPDRVWFSDVADPQTFTRDTNYFDVAPGENDEITGLIAFRKSKELYIFKTDSIHKLNCYGGTPMTDWTLNVVDTAHGCIAPRSIVVVGNDIFYLSRDGVRSIRTTEYNIEQGVDLPLSWTMKTVWDTRNNTNLKDACAIYYDGEYRCSIPTSTNVYNDTTLVYNVQSKGWTYHTGYSPSVYTIWVESGKENLYFGEDQADTFVYRLDNGYSDNPSGVATAITYSEETREYTFKAPTNWKVGDVLEVRASAAGGYKIDVYVSIDGEAWVNVGEMNVDNTAPTFPMTFPISFGATVNLIETFHLENFGKFKRIKFKFEENDSTSDEIKILYHQIRSYLEEYYTE